MQRDKAALPLEGRSRYEYKHTHVSISIRNLGVRYAKAGTKAPAYFVWGLSVQSERGKRSTKVREKDWDHIVASVISATRQDLDMSQQQLADELGWTRDAVSNLENQRRHCKVSDLIRIAKAFGMEPDALFQRIVHW